MFRPENHGCLDPTHARCLELVETRGNVLTGLSEHPVLDHLLAEPRTRKALLYPSIFDDHVGILLRKCAVHRTHRLLVFLATRPKLVLVDEQLVYLIGRNTECSLVIAEPAQPLMGSGLHAYIYFQPETKAWCLKDFSLNGTSVNGDHLDKNAAVHLVHRDKVQFGTKESVYTFVFWNPNGAAGNRHRFYSFSFL